MNLNLLKSSLLAVALCCGGGVAQATISSLPMTAAETFDNGTTGIFSGGDIVNTTDIGYVLAITKGKNVTLEFDTKGDSDSESKPYTLSSNETVTISYVEYNGYLSKRAMTMELKNSAGVVLVGYTYNTSECKITDVKIGGNTVGGFASFLAQSLCGTKGANGFKTNAYQKNTDTNAYNPTISISISQNGFVEISFKGGKITTEQKFTGTLASGTTVDLKTLNFSTTVDVENGDRRCAIDDFQITTETKAVTMVGYTINKVCGNDVLETTQGQAPDSTTLTVDKNAVTKDSQKYIYVSDNFENTGAVTSGKDNVYTISYRKANEYNYTVTSNLNTTIASGKSIEGDAVTVGYPRYINNNGTLYTKATTNSQYRISFTPDVNNYSNTLEYTATQTNNVVYYSEAENIEGLTVNTSNNVPVRASNALAALASEDTKITTLPAGKYIIHAGVFSSATNPSYTIKFTAGSQTLSAPVKYINASEVALDEITLNEATDLKLLAEGMNERNCLLDYIYIVRTGEIAPVTDAKFATYSPSSNIKAGSNSNVKFYTAKISGNNIVLTPVTDGTVLKAGTGYVIAATEEGNYDFSLSSEEGTAVAGNELQVAGANGVTATTDSKYYVLTKRTDGKVGFGKVKTGVKIPAGKCYIDASATPATATLSAEFLEITNVLTGIDAVDAEPEADAYYTLQGVKLSQPVKGINIINGKKVLVK